MTPSRPRSSALAPVDQPSESIAAESVRRVSLVVACTIGTTLEWYDFFLFSACAILVFDKIFFATGDPEVDRMLSLCTIAAGFVARPVGGVLLGLVGDRYGRKRLLIASFYLMGGGTIALAALPTYAQVGPVAPITLIVLRIVQGLAVGGETTGAMLMIAEAMPRRRRAFWTSLTMASGPLANVLTALAISTVKSRLGDAAFEEWGWRIPFLVGGILMPIGLWTRHGLRETLAFDRPSLFGRQRAEPNLLSAIRVQRMSMAKCFCVKLAESTFLYAFSTFILLFGTLHLAVRHEAILQVIFWGSLIEICMSALAARLADVHGRRPLLLVGLSAACLTGFLLFRLGPDASQAQFQWVTIACFSSHGLIMGGMAAYLVELFPARVRCTTLSTSYQAAAALAGAATPILGNTILTSFGSGAGVAIYLIAVTVPAAFWVVRSSETIGSDLSVP